MVTPIRDSVVNRVTLSGEGGGVLSLNGETGNITITSIGETIAITTPNATTINLEAVGGGGEPAGDTSQVQYNDDGAFGADEGFTRDPDTFETIISREIDTGIVGEYHLGLVTLPAGGAEGSFHVLEDSVSNVTTISGVGIINDVQGALMYQQNVAGDFSAVIVERDGDPTTALYSILDAGQGTVVALQPDKFVIAKSGELSYFIADTADQTVGIATVPDGTARLSVAGKPATPDTAFTGSGLNDLTVTGNYDGSFGTGPIFTIAVVALDFGGTTDIVSFSVNGDVLAPTIPIDGVFPATIAGLTFAFGSPLGHTVADEWNTTLIEGLDIFRAIPPDGLNDFSDGGTYDESTDGTDPFYRFVISSIQSPNLVDLFVNGSLEESGLSLSSDFPYTRAGLTFDFTGDDGHTLGDAWDVQVVGDSIVSTTYDAVVPVSIDAFGHLFYPVGAAPGHALITNSYSGQVEWSPYPVAYGSLGVNFVAFGDSNGNITGNDTFTYNAGILTRTRTADVQDQILVTSAPSDQSLLRSISINAVDGFSNTVECGYMRWAVEGTPGVNSIPTKLTAAINSGSGGAPSEFFFVTPVGNIGLGISNADEKLQIYGVTHTRGLRANTSDASAALYTINKDDFTVYVSDVSDSPVITMPTVATAKVGAIYKVVDLSNAADALTPITVTNSESLPMDGIGSATSVTIDTAGAALEFQLFDVFSVGFVWKITASYKI